jgi:hypothetical protein
MPNLTSSDEQKLIDGVKQAVHYVDDNDMLPDDALAKVAKDMSFTPGFVKAAVNAFNNGRQVSQWKANTPVLDKLAEFPLASYTEIHKQIWGGTEKEAKEKYLSLGDEIHSDYQKAPQWSKENDLSKLATMDLGLEKAAADEEVPEYIQTHEHTKKVNAVWDVYARTKRAHEEARGRHYAARDRLDIHLNVLTSYFKKFAQDRLPFDVVDKAAKSYYGSRGTALMNVVAEQFPDEKRAADTKRYWDKPLSRDAEPFTFVASSIKAAKDLHATTNALGMAKQAWEEAKEALLPFVPTPSPSNQKKDTTFSISLIDDGVGEKEAGTGMGLLLGMAGRPVADALVSGDAIDRKVSKTVAGLEDPRHEDELRKIRAQVMLAEMLGDSQNPISQYDPAEVLAAYNELTQLAPRIAEQPAAMQPLLAKRLAGGTEPFEIKEISDIEKGIQQTHEHDSSANILKQSHDSILN